MYQFYNEQLNLCIRYVKKKPYTYNKVQKMKQLLTKKSMVLYNL